MSSAVKPLTKDDEERFSEDAAYRLAYGPDMERWGDCGLDEKFSRLLSWTLVFMENPWKQSVPSKSLVTQMKVRFSIAWYFRCRNVVYVDEHSIK